jgi:protein ECT2
MLERLACFSVSIGADGPLIISGVDFHMFLEVPPQDQSERWSGRPFRALSIVHPPHPVNFDPVRSQTDKYRFLENLWTAQAMYRAKHGRSVVLYSSEREMEARAGRVTLARTYLNVYQRTAYLGEPKKVN